MFRGSGLLLSCEMMRVIIVVSFELCAAWIGVIVKDAVYKGSLRVTGSCRMSSSYN